MKVRHLSMENFGAYGGEPTTVDLPETGLVLVTGPNGSGKSSIIEAVSHALWHDSPRGTSRAWVDGAKGSVSAETDVVVAARKRTKGGKTSLVWKRRDDNDSDVEYATPTKAQAALESIVGSFDAWRRTSLFSSADAAHFTLATDKARKLLLEELLGMVQFDRGLSRCRGDLGEARGAVSRLTSNVRVLDERIAGHERRIADAEAWTDPGNGPGLDAMRHELTGIRESLELARAELAEAERAYREVDHGSVKAKVEVAHLRERRAVLKGGRCPTCGQDVHAKLAEEIEVGIGVAIERADVAIAMENAERTEVAAECEDLRETVAALDRREATVTAQGKALRAVADQRREHAKVLASARDELSRSRDEADAARVELRLAQKQVDTLVAVEQVLGLRGPRSQILAGALVGIEVVANARLAQLGDGYGVRLRSFRQNKDGSSSDSIGLEVRTPTAPEWRSYLSASGGQRRRVDVAIVLGLAAAVGGDGTVFFDEVFDALDRDGSERACSMIRELAVDRCVVVVSHSEDLISSLSPDVHLRCGDGKVEVA